MAYNLTDYSFPEFAELVKKTPTVILPVGLIEQHGYHLPLGTDIFNVTEPLRIGFDRIDAFLAPGLHYCFSGGGFQGTMNTNPQLFGLMVTDICGEFVAMGFRNIIIYLGHGGTENIESLKLSLQVFLRDEKNRDIAVCLAAVGAMSKRFSDITRGDENGQDFHAGEHETSCMLYWRPELVHMERLRMDEPEMAQMLRTDQDWYAERSRAFDDPICVERVVQRPDMKVGVMGFPERAKAETGEVICRENIESLTNLVNRLNARP